MKQIRLDTKVKKSILSVHSVIGAAPAASRSDPPSPPCRLQIVQPAAIAPALLAGRFVLVGDPQQLPPVIQSPAARRRGMDECLFSRLAADDNTVQLTLQYRMNRALTAAANHLTYGGRLSCGSEQVETATVRELERKVRGGDGYREGAGAKGEGGNGYREGAGAKGEGWRWLPWGIYKRWRIETTFMMELEWNVRD